MITKNRSKQLITAIICVAIAIALSFGFLNVNSYAAESKVATKTTLTIKVGRSYKLAKASYVYKGPGKKYGRVLRKNLRGGSKKYAVKGIKYAKFKKGTRVTCLKKKGKWVKVPSGWIKRVNLRK